MKPWIVGLGALAVGLGGGAAVAQFVPITVEEKQKGKYTARVRTAGFSLEDRSMLFTAEVRKPAPEGFSPLDFKPLVTVDQGAETVRKFKSPTTAMAAALEAIAVDQQGLDSGTDGVILRGQRVGGPKMARIDLSVLEDPGE